MAGIYLFLAEFRSTTDRSVEEDYFSKARQANLSHLKYSKSMHYAQPKAMRFMRTYHWLCRNYRTAQRSIVSARENEYHPDLGRTHLEIGKRLGDRTHLEHTKSIFAEIGAEWDLEQTKKAIKLVAG